MTECIVFLDRSAIPAAFRRPRFPHMWQEHPDTPAEFVLERLREATIAITNRVSLNEENLTQLPNLRFIAVAATGYDIVDIDACNRLGIAVSNVRDWCTTSVAEHVFGLIFALQRKLFEVRDQIQSGAWQRSQGSLMPTLPPPRDLAGSQIGLIGHGVVAQRVAQIARGLGMKVAVAEHKGAKQMRPGRVQFESLLLESDIVSLHCPLTEETRGLIGARELALMKQTSLLINCARGGIVDDHALGKSLINGEIGGAGLDVLGQEPPRNGNPLLELTTPNLIITPHTAWVSQSALTTFAEQLIRNLECFVSGRPQNVITSGTPNPSSDPIPHRRKLVGVSRRPSHDNG
jgi:glycerate dehydrogenase